MFQVGPNPSSDARAEKHGHEGKTGKLSLYISQGCTNTMGTCNSFNIFSKTSFTAGLTQNSHIHRYKTGLGFVVLAHFIQIEYLALALLQYLILVFLLIPDTQNGCHPNTLSQNWYFYPVQVSVSVPPHSKTAAVFTCQFTQTLSQFVLVVVFGSRVI